MPLRQTRLIVEYLVIFCVCFVVGATGKPPPCIDSRVQYDALQTLSDVEDLESALQLIRTGFITVGYGLSCTVSHIPTL